jgi:hypothetical protein
MVENLFKTRETSVASTVRGVSFFSASSTSLLFVLVFLLVSPSFVSAQSSAYSSSGAAWTSLSSTRETIGAGAALTAAIGCCGAPSNLIFATGGGGSNTFWRYNMTSNKWLILASTPGPVGAGGAIVEAPAISVGISIFALQGGGHRGFWEYNVKANTWSKLASAPGAVKAGGALTQLGGKIYAFAGGGTKDFWSYSVKSNSWKTLAPAPGGVGPGGSLAGINYGIDSRGDFIAALQGGGKDGYWLYSADNNTWLKLASAPLPVGNGASLTTENYDNGMFTALLGNGSNQVWCFSNIAGGNWTNAGTFIGNEAPGSAIVAPFNPPGVFAFLGGTRNFSEEAVPFC